MHLLLFCNVIQNEQESPVVVAEKADRTAYDIQYSCADRCLK